jgi:cytochrome d ubiquinol oxidase subunit II
MYKGGELQSFVGSAIIIIGLAGIAAVGNFPDMVPARGTPPATSLTVERAASEDLTLTVMLILALIFVPVVLIYTALIYKTFWGKTKASEADY